MDVAFPIIGLIAIYGVAAWLLTHGIRRVIRLQFPRLHRRLDKNELVKFLMPILVGASCAVATPAVVMGWFGVAFPDACVLYVILWSKIIVGGGAGLGSALIYKGVRAFVKAKLRAIAASRPGSDVPPDADRP